MRGAPRPMPGHQAPPPAPLTLGGGPQRAQTGPWESSTIQPLLAVLTRRAGCRPGRPATRWRRQRCRCWPGEQSARTAGSACKQGVVSGQKSDPMRAPPPPRQPSPPLILIAMHSASHSGDLRVLSADDDAAHGASHGRAHRGAHATNGALRHLHRHGHGGGGGNKSRKLKGDKHLGTPSGSSHSDSAAKKQLLYCIAAILCIVVL